MRDRNKQLESAEFRTLDSSIQAVVGLDLGDRCSQASRYHREGRFVENRPVKTTRQALTAYFTRRERWRIVLEAGTHANWVYFLLERLGHEVVMVNPRKLKEISGSKSKDDIRDADLLAELGYSSARRLQRSDPIRLEHQLDRAQLRCREDLVKARTGLISAVRNQHKSFGYRLPPCDADQFARKARPLAPAELLEAVLPLLRAIEGMTTQIRELNKRLEQMAREKYPATQLLRQIPGVGLLTSLAYVLSQDNDPHRVKKSRQAGAVVGLRPGWKKSGNQQTLLGVTKCGDAMVRTYLVQCAHYILGRRGEDSALRRWGLELAGRGGRGAKQKAAAALARKLAVVLHVLWSRGETYEPFPEAQPQAA